LLLRRPITTYMIILAVMIFGLVALSRLSVNLLPEINAPVLLIRTQWDGASAREVERTVNERLEASLSTINGVQHVQSIAKQGLSLISLQFGWKTNMNLAFLNTREKLDQVQYSFPSNVSRPELIRSSPSDAPIAVLSITSKSSNANSFNTKMELRQWTDQVLTRRLEQIDGVAQAVMVGSVQPEVQIHFNSKELDQYGLTLTHVQQAIQNANRFSSTGQLRDGWYRYSLKIESKLQSLDEIRHLPIAKLGTSKILHLDDVATIHMGQHTPTSFSQLDQQSILSVLVKKDYGSNTVRDFDKIKPILKSLKQQYPDIKVQVLTETASTIRNTISNLLQTLLVGGILAFLILFIYLRDPRMPLSIGISIPISIFLTFLVMYLANIQLNIISLSGLTLGIGLLVDNSIVVLDNIQRHRKVHPNNMLRAAGDGTREVAMAVTASTLTTISVFLPLVFLGGFQGVFFRDQALTLSISLVASLLVAIIILPVLVVQLQKGRSHPNWDRDYSFVLKVQDTYEQGLQSILRHPLLGLSIFVAGILLAAAGFIYLPKNVLPSMPAKRLEYRVTLPANTSLKTSHFVAGQMITNIQKKAHTDNILSLGGYTDQTNLAELSEESLNRFRIEIPTKNDKQTQRIRDVLATWETRHPKWTILPLQTNSPFRTLLNFDTTPLKIEFVGNNRNHSVNLSQKFDRQIQKQYPDWKMKVVHGRKQQIWSITFNNGALLDLGITENQVINYLQSLSAGNEVTEWDHDQDEIQVRLFSKHGHYTQLANLAIPSNGRMIPLQDVAKVQKIDQPEQLSRINQTPVLTYATNVSLIDWWLHRKEYRSFIQQFIHNNGIRIIPSGLALQLQQLFLHLGWLLLLSVVIIFIILASQFESLLYPFIILFSIPFAWIGSILLLWTFGLGLNIFSFLGLLVLTGIAVNDAILKVDFMKRYYERFGNLWEAITKAGEHRFRSVVMTTLTTVLGLLPMTIPWGEGYAYRQSLGVSLMGGMISSTLLTLFLIPLIFLWVQRFRERLLGKPEMVDGE